MKFCIIDVSNLVHRAKHALARAGSTQPFDPFADDDPTDLDEERMGMILSIFFLGLHKAALQFDPDHMVAAFDRRSWRRDFYEDYKANRRDKVMTPAEEREHELVTRTIDEIETFLSKFTNVTVLSSPNAEADDMIARWVQLHDDPVFEHVIYSADGDFRQLVRPGVILFNPIHDTLTCMDGVFFQDGKRPKKTDPVVDLYGKTWKVKLDKKTGDPVEVKPDWDLFEKCIRGDSSDNIPSAYPRVRTDRMKKAFYGGVEEYNNFINSQWGNGDDKKLVKDLYERNRILIDLTAQPDEVVEQIDLSIEDALSRDPNKMVGAYFAKFCVKHRLNKLNSMSQKFTEILASDYG